MSFKSFNFQFSCHLIKISYIKAGVLAEHPRLRKLKLLLQKKKKNGI